VRSASAITLFLGFAGCALAALAMSGCDTTQDAAARIKVRSERTLASRKPTRVSKQAKQVAVSDVTLLESGDGTAVAVTLRNRGDEPVNDLPLSVGLRTPDGGREYLNDRKELPYFRTHAPALAAGAVGTWVYTTKERFPDAGSAFAEVGRPAGKPVTVASSVPVLDVGSPKLAGDEPPKVEVEVSNGVGFVQYDLEVFAWATRRDRIVAAGAAPAGDLEPDETEPVAVRLIGDAKGAELHVSAPPTIYQ